MANHFRQCFFIPAPTYTENDCPDQHGRVWIVTGGYAGVGYYLSDILYKYNATVYIAGRSETKAASAIEKIRSASPKSTGKVEFMHLDLSDLTTIKPAVEKFQTLESRLDILVNNAGVMFPPAGSLDAQKHELHMGTNCLGSYLLYHLLEPILTKTAASSPKGSVRVTWAGSLALDLMSPKPGGIIMNTDGSPKDLGVQPNYGQSKVGNLFLAKVLAKQTPSNGIVHACFNPGNLRTELQRHWKGVGATLADWFLLHPGHNGAYTELWAGLSPELTPELSGAYVIPWGRIGSFRPDLEEAIDAGNAAKFVSWCQTETKPYA